MNVYFKGIEKRIAQQLETASKSIHIAVAWFTNPNLLPLLVKKAKAGVEVKLIIRNDYINNSAKSLKWKTLLDAGGKLFFYTPTAELHHKFCIIDRRIVLSGSYNWTSHAEKKSRENIILIIAKILADEYSKEFDSLLKTSIVPNVNELNNIALAKASQEDIIFLEEEQKLNESLLVETSQDDDILEEVYGLYRTKEYDRAIKKVNPFINENPQNGEAYYQKGWVLYRQKKFDSALENAKKAIELGYTPPDAYDLLGNCLSENINTISDAVKYFDKAISIDKYITTFYWNKILAFKKRGSFKEAEDVKLELLAIIKDIVKNSIDNFILMHAYIQKGFLFDVIYKKDRKKYGIKAKELYDLLPDHQKDKHHLEDIQILLDDN